MRNHHIFGAMIAILFASPSFAAQWNSLSDEQQHALEKYESRWPELSDVQRALLSDLVLYAIHF